MNKLFYIDNSFFISNLLAMILLARGNLSINHSIKNQKIKLQGIVVITRNKMNSEIWVKKNFLLYIFIFHNFQQQFSLFIFHNRTFYFFTFLLIEGYLTTFNKLSFKEILNSFLTLDKFEIFGKEIAIFFFYLY